MLGNHLKLLSFALLVGLLPADLLTLLRFLGGEKVGARVSCTDRGVSERPEMPPSPCGSADVADLDDSDVAGTSPDPKKDPKRALTAARIPDLAPTL